MSKLSFEIFKTVKDRSNWDKHIEYIKRSDEVTEEQRKKLITTYQILKNELGKGFLKNTIDLRLGHTITNYVLMRGDEAYSWIIWLAENLEYFKKRDCNYNELISKLKSIKDCDSEGIPFLEIAESYRKVGFEVVFEPLKKRSNQKTPDLKIVNPTNNETFYVEISRLNESEDRLDKRKIYYTIFDKFLSPPILPFGGKILKKFEDKELSEVIKKIDYVKKQVQNQSDFSVFSNESIEFALAPDNKEKKVKEWCEQKKYDYGNIISLHHNFDETNRIRGNKIPKKAPQIPINHFGLIYITVHPLYFYAKNPFEAIYDFENKLNEFQNVLGLVVYSKIGDKSDDTVYFDKLHFFSSRTVFKTLRKDILFVFNNKCEIKIFPDTLEKIYCAINN